MTTEPASAPDTSDDQDDVEDNDSSESSGLSSYPINELSIRDERRAAQDVVRRIEQGRYVLDPDFQRDFVWKKDKQSRLIESIIMRIPLPVFYMAENPDGTLVVVDGRQRLTTLKRFLHDELKLHLPKRRELHGKRFSELSPALYQIRVEDCQLHFYIIDHKTPDRARLDIFERVNGGEVLTRQQMRNALYNGPATHWLREQAGSELFVRVTGGSLRTKTMQDREFVNRFVAFSLLGLPDYKGELDDWLGQGLKALRDLTSQARATLVEAFERSLTNNEVVFGKHAFRKHDSPNQSQRNRINAALFDVMSTGLASYPQQQVVAKAQGLRNGLYALFRNPAFFNAISYSTNGLRSVNDRFTLARQLFAEVFGAYPAQP